MSDTLEGWHQSCQNAKSQFCNDNVHNIILKMLLEYPKFISDTFIGGLFDGPYKIFENNQCIQYIQEYVPFHLPQIENGLRPALQHIYENLSCQGDKPIRILDMGSGPATTAISFCRLLDKFSNKINLQISTMEPSTTFNEIIAVFSKENLNRNITITDHFDYTFDDFLSLSYILKGEYDWVIAANIISALGGTIDIININLNKLLTDLLDVGQQIYVTLIETNNPMARRFMRSEVIESQNLYKEIIFNYCIQLSVNDIKNCNFYNTKYGNYAPYLNTKTIKLGLK